VEIKELTERKEEIAAKVHDAWWETKKAAGFHAPVDCPKIKSLGFYKTPERFKFCDLCHPDMYPYDSLPEDIKDYDRVTVDTVLKAISEIEIMSRDDIFIRHIKKHLHPWEHVICKICRKTADEIIRSERTCHE